MWTSNPLLHMPFGWWAAWASVQFPAVGVFMGPSDKEPKRVRTREQQVENYWELSNSSGHKPHLAQVRAAPFGLQILRHHATLMGTALCSLGELSFHGQFSCTILSWFFLSKWGDALSIAGQAMNRDINCCSVIPAGTAACSFYGAYMVKLTHWKGSIGSRVPERKAIRLISALWLSEWTCWMCTQRRALNVLKDRVRTQARCAVASYIEKFHKVSPLDVHLGFSIW